MNKAMDLGWMKRAECTGMPASIFYPEDDEPDNEAKAICARCAVQEECLAYAIKHEADGVWGGYSPKQRRRERKRLAIRVAPYRTLGSLPDHGECGTAKGYDALMRYYRTHPDEPRKRCGPCLEASTRYATEGRVSKKRPGN